MLNFFKKEKFPIKIFITVSLANFILISLLFFLLKHYFRTSGGDFSPETNQANYITAETNEGDPLITKVPQLRDLLAGPIISDDDPGFGPIDSKVIITEFSDFFCGYCFEQEKIIKEIINDYPNSVRLIWKDYPEGGLSSNSWQAAIAARCAAEQGKFWDYHNRLYEELSKEEGGADLFLRIAKEVNLRENLFKECLTDKEIIQLIKDNVLEAQALDINGIPFIYVNNQEVFGQINYEDFKRLVEIELKK